MDAIQTHVVIPDTQVRPGVNTDHLEWIGRYIVDEFSGRPLTIVHLGDHYDMPSLSSYDRGKRQMEGRRYVADIAAGNEALARLSEPIVSHYKKRKDKPRRVFLLGNHENRISRAAEDNAQLDGLVTLDHLNAAELGWEVHDFLKPVFIDGVGYAHYWYAPLTSRPWSGTIDNRLKNIGHSFTMGHQQTLLYGVRYVGGRSQHGLVAGACYTHQEEYRGPQAEAHWRGIIVKHQVEHGSYDMMLVSLDYLARRYTGKRLRLAA